MTADAIVRARRPSVVVAAVLALAWSGPAMAQTQLYLLTSGTHAVVTDPNCQPWDYGCELNGITDPGRVIHLDVDRRQIVTNTPVSHTHGAAAGPRITPDGRLLLWSGWNLEPSAPYRVSLFDIAGRQQATPFGASIGSDFVPLTVHPSAMRAFLGLSPSGPVTVAEPGNTYVLPSPPCPQPRFSTRSGDGRRLSYYCDQPRSVMVADSVDGRLLGSVPLGVSAFSVVATRHVLDGAGTTIYAADWDNAYEGDAVLYRRFDVATGALLAERRGSTNVIFSWTLNDATGHLYAGTWSGILVIDANTLVEIGWIASWYPATFPKVALDPDQPYAYVAWPKDSGGALRLSAFHTGTFATLGSLDIQFGGQLVGLALGPRPPRLSGLQVGMAGNLATLTWDIDASRSIATGQLVEAGFTSGQTVVRLPVSAGATSLLVPGVPPGRYFVRIRSVNGTGVGAPSNEVLVDVP